MNGGFIPRITQMRSSCMFHALRKEMKCPREFTNTHLRRMVVLFIIKNFEMLWPSLHVSVMSNFGHIRMPEKEFQSKLATGILTDQERAIHNEPGPYSVYGNLDQLLKPEFYGDELCLLVVLMIWRVRITILHAETLTLPSLFTYIYASTSGHLPSHSFVSMCIEEHHFVQLLPFCSTRSEGKIF